MEETGTTIHSRLTRRNNFLRENPQSGYFAASTWTSVMKGRIATKRPGRTAG